MKHFSLQATSSVLLGSNAGVAEASLDQALQYSPHDALHRTPQLRLPLYGLLILIDLLCISIAMITASVIRSGNWQTAEGLELLVLLAPIYLAIAANCRSYGLEALQKPNVGIDRALKALATAAVVAITMIFALKSSTNFSRLVLALGVVLGAILIWAFRSSVGNWIGKLYSWRFTNQVLIIDGMPLQPRDGELVIFTDTKRTPLEQDAVVMDRLGTALKFADKVVLAAQPEQRAAWTNTLRGIGVDIEVLAPEIDTMRALALRSYGSSATLLISTSPLGLIDSAKKRALDLAVTIPALALLAIPLGLIALAIKIETPGPILFRQRRVGQGNRIFQMLKFRSMHSDAQDSSAKQLTTRNDGRMTKVGKFIRRTSLDELPQLINVLRGEMSLVGPRPHALEAKANELLYWDVHPSYWVRGAVKPGLTGLAQVRGHRGPTDTAQHLINRVDSDLEYLNGWSLRRDIGIMFKTLRVIAHPNAF